eukprot:COSAG02_NODE_2855_length_7889_cov_3.123363_2_plen_179_part_00
MDEPAFVAVCPVGMRTAPAESSRSSRDAPTFSGAETKISITFDSPHLPLEPSDRSTCGSLRSYARSYPMHCAMQQCGGAQPARRPAPPSKPSDCDGYRVVRIVISSSVFVELVELVDVSPAFVRIITRPSGMLLVTARAPWYQRHSPLVRLSRSVPPFPACSRRPSKSRSGCTSPAAQ